METLSKDLSLIDRVRSNLDNVPLRKAAKEVGVSRDVFTFMRQLIVLKDRQILIREEEDLVNQSLSILEADRHQLKAARDIVQTVLDRYWKKKTRNGSYSTGAKQHRPVAKLKHRFDKTIFTIGEVCANVENMQIPILTHQERESAASVLVDSMLAVAKLITQIKRGLPNE